jgi:hypothetical protein
MRPNKSIERNLKKYDKHLYIKWNHEYKYFEVWFKRIRGHMLVTPVVEAIYKENGSTWKRERLDRRIIDWVYSADTFRHTKKWKWISRKKLTERKSRDKQKRYDLFRNIAADGYNLTNNEYINPLVACTDWMGPDMHMHNRIACRSADNAKKYFGRDN